MSNTGLNNSNKLLKHDYPYVILRASQSMK